MNSNQKSPLNSNQSPIRLYSRFVPFQILNLLGKKSIAEVNIGDSIEKTMTILFADIRDFTTLSEQMTPQENFAFINSYLKQMEPIISRHGGIIDKYMGDAIMALFPGLPDDALHSAIEMLEQISVFNAIRNKSGNIPIKIGLGINTGLMMLGIIGGERYLSVTVISDAVNLASRIESLTKIYGTPLLISEQTYYGLADAAHHETRFIDRLKVRGREQPQSVYEVFDADPLELRQAKGAGKSLFEEAIAYYHLKKIIPAIELLSKYLHQIPQDMAAQVYKARAERFLKTGLHESSGELDLIIQWDSSLAIGHPTIDAQHRDLFAQVNAFVNALRENAEYAQLHSLIEFLNEYTNIHFQTEEQFMAEHEYPFLKFQKEQHRRFLEHFQLFQKEIKGPPSHPHSFLLFRAQILLIDWLVNHTAKLDKHFGKFLSSVKKF